MATCPLGGPCHRECGETCDGVEDFSRAVSDGQEVPQDPAERVA